MLSHARRAGWGEELLKLILSMQLLWASGWSGSVHCSCRPVSRRVSGVVYNSTRVVSHVVRQVCVQMKQDRNSCIWTLNYVVYTNERKMDATFRHSASSAAGAALIVRS